MCGQHRAWDEEGVEEVVSRLECTGLVLTAVLSHSQPPLRWYCLSWIESTFNLNGGLHRSGSTRKMHGEGKPSSENQLW